MGYLSLLLTICIAISFNYGLIRFQRRRHVLYMQMILFGIGCAMAGRLFETLMLFINGELPTEFHIGILGTAGSVLFFFTANYGQMDSLVDDGSSHFLKYRIRAVCAPILMTVLYAIYVIFAGFGIGSIIRGVESAIIASASYYNLKHLIIEDVDMGIIRSIRTYNFLALVYEALLMLEMVVSVLPVPGFVIAAIYLMISAVMLVFTPALEKGVEKWTV